ncbi:MAG: hypothetical protein IT440_04225 [Phycisphaeraceae bacterium]|nr:hypothetical protein [Phycisphaeraceae bacterium]
MNSTSDNVCDSGLEAEFRDPSPSRRGAPFWVWNDALDKDRLVRQIAMLREMGMGGFFIHSRTGLDAEYLGPHFMDCVKASVEQAASLGMKAWLYDEDRWPSGYAGGLITQDDAGRERYLLLTRKPYGPTPPTLPAMPEMPIARNERGRLLARYAVRLNKGYLAHYQRLADGDPAPADATIWYAYLEIQWPCGGWNNATLGDVLNPRHTRRFLEVTHERYAAAVGSHFGSVVPGIFTDEPHFLHKQRPARAEDQNDLRLPFTDDLPDTYRQAFADDLLDHLPEVVWDMPDGEPSLTRYRFHHHLCDRLVDGFLKPISQWCREHHLPFTGHLVEETELESQTSMTGEVMRGYPHMDIPGIDQVSDKLELTTAKQCQSVVRQLGKTAMVSEMYGASGWDFSFAEFKSQGDWHAALGVTLRVHHLAWSSMLGEAKRDYPGSIFYQQPWWREYRLLEDHYARLNTLLTRGRPAPRVGVIHPIESYWLCFGPQDTSGPQAQLREQQFRELTEWLLFDQIDFDFISESLLPSLCPLDAVTDRLPVGEMTYDVIIVPNLRTIRATTLQRLTQFAQRGGRVVFLGETPSLVDVQPCDEPAQLARHCECLPMDRPAVFNAMDSMRTLDIRLPDGSRPDRLLHQWREDNERRVLFICNTDRTRGCDAPQFRVAGPWRVTSWDTMTGDRASLPVSIHGNATTWTSPLPPHGHQLFTLEPAATTSPAIMISPAKRTAWHGALPEHVAVSLSEPNALPLDMARWRWNDGNWQPREELLRIEDVVRKMLHLSLRRSYNPQPWCVRGPSPALGQLTLEYDVDCRCTVDQPQLALEVPAKWRMLLDGRPVTFNDMGWWVDEAIRVTRLPTLTPGRHQLTLQTDFTRDSALEWAYLLGDFSVTSTASDAALAQPVTQLGWGDWTTQGLPFFTGAATYHLPLELDQPRTLQLRLPAMGNPAVAQVLVNDTDAGIIAFAPYIRSLGTLPAGRHMLHITVHGSRNNAFGPLHHPGPNNRIQDPTLWHTTGSLWDVNRHVTPKGILQPPALDIES